MRTAELQPTEGAITADAIPDIEHATTERASLFVQDRTRLQGLTDKLITASDVAAVWTCHSSDRDIVYHLPEAHFLAPAFTDEQLSSLPGRLVTDMQAAQKKLLMRDDEGKFKQLFATQGNIAPQNASISLVADDADAQKIWVIASVAPKAERSKDFTFRKGFELGRHDRKLNPYGRFEFALHLDRDAAMSLLQTEPHLALMAVRDAILHKNMESDIHDVFQQRLMEVSLQLPMQEAEYVAVRDISSDTIHLGRLHEPSKEDQAMQSTLRTFDLTKTEDVDAALESLGSAGIIDWVAPPAEDVMQAKNSFFDKIKKFFS